MVKPSSPNDTSRLLSSLATIVSGFESQKRAAKYKLSVSKAMYTRERSPGVPNSLDTTMEKSSTDAASSHAGSSSTPSRTGGASTRTAATDLRGGSATSLAAAVATRHKPGVTRDR